jgi:hypothetical protein
METCTILDGKVYICSAQAHSLAVRNERGKPGTALVNLQEIADCEEE